MIRLPTRLADLFAGPFLVGVAAVAVFAVWAANDAGYASTTWYPGGLFLLALAVVTVVAYGGVSLSRPALVAIVFLGAFAAWCALSITWASDKGIAWDGANRTVLYFLVYALFVSLPGGASRSHFCSSASRSPSSPSASSRSPLQRAIRAPIS